MARRGESVERGLGKLVRAHPAVRPSVFPRATLERETERLEKWFRSLWKPKAPPESFNAVYFGIGEFSDGRYDLYCTVLPGKGEVEDWEFSHGRFAKDEYAQSEILAFCRRRTGRLRIPTRETCCAWA